jgi:hypothetical protein
VPASPHRAAAISSAPIYDDGYGLMQEGERSQVQHNDTSNRNIHGTASLLPEGQDSVAEELARRKAELLALEDSFADEFGDSLDNDDGDNDALGWTEASNPQRSATNICLQSHQSARLSNSNGHFITKGFGLRSSSGIAAGHRSYNKADSRRYPPSDDAAAPRPSTDPSADPPGDAYYSSRDSPSLFRSSRDSGGGGGGVPVPTRTSPAKATTSSTAAASAAARRSRSSLHNAHASSAPGTEEEEGDETLFGTQQLDAVALPTEDDADVRLAEASRSSLDAAADRGGLTARRRGNTAGVAGASAEALASLLQWAATEEQEGGGGERREGGDNNGEVEFPLAASSEERLFPGADANAAAAASTAADALRPSALLAPNAQSFSGSQGYGAPGNLPNKHGDDIDAVASSAAFAEAAAPSPYLGSGNGPGSKGSTGGDDSLELVFNPVLNAYYDPSSGRFYHLKDDEVQTEPGP